MESGSVTSLLTLIAAPTIWRYGKPTISWLLEVDIGIAEGPTGDHVSANSDGEYGPSRAKFLVEHGLGNVWMQVSHIEGGHWIAGRARIHAARCVFSGNRTTAEL